MVLDRTSRTFYDLISHKYGSHRDLTLQLLTPNLTRIAYSKKLTFGFEVSLKVTLMLEFLSTFFFDSSLWIKISHLKKNALNVPNLKEVYFIVHIGGVSTITYFVYSGV